MRNYYTTSKPRCKLSRWGCNSHHKRPHSMNRSSRSRHRSIHSSIHNRWCCKSRSSSRIRVRCTLARHQGCCTSGNSSTLIRTRSKTGTRICKSYGCTLKISILHFCISSIACSGECPGKSLIDRGHTTLSAIEISKKNRILCCTLCTLDWLLGPNSIFEVYLLLKIPRTPHSDTISSWGFLMFMSTV